MNDWLVVNYVIQSKDEIFDVCEEQERNKPKTAFRWVKMIATYVPIVVRIFM